MKKNNKKGFTLVELVIVVAVMAVLVAVAIPTVKSITKTAKDTVADTNARTIESMLKLKEAELSKNGDTIVALTTTTITSALNDAKLGITDGYFKYDSGAGTVTAEEKPETLPTAANTPKGTFYISYADSALTIIEGTKTGG